ncbi:MAG TPA: ATP-binding protein [Campylobacterales bacterium]|nr:ATP-binding protein [Campylobacterales bacterium]
MIINLKIRNFKSIKDEISLSFEPVEKEDDYYIYEHNNQKILKMLMIYGQNASGKTNILKALEFLRDFIFSAPINKNDKINIKPFLFTKDIKNDSYFEIEFLQNGIKYLYQLTVSDVEVIDERLYFYNPNKALVFDRKEFKFGSKINIKKSQKESLLNNTLINNTLLSGYMKTNIKIKEFDEVINWFSRLMKPIYPSTDLLGFTSNLLHDKEIDKQFIVNLLKNADFAIDNFEVIENDIDEEFKEFLLHLGKEKDADNFKKIDVLFTHYKRYQLDFISESRGTQRFYQLVIVLYLLLRDCLILPIDELESSLHPDLLKHFLLIFLANSKESQLIFTTHSRELLLEKDILRFDTIYFTEKKEDGSTELFSLSDFDSNIIRKESSIYNIYKNGKLGANPNLKNYFLDI